MYVKKVNDDIFFRMDNQDDEAMWEEHGWVPWPAIQKAIEMYTGKGFDPSTAYDIALAKEVLS